MTRGKLGILMLLIANLLAIGQGCQVVGSWHDEGSLDVRSDFSDLFQIQDGVPIYTTTNSTEYGLGDPFTLVMGIKDDKPWVDAMWDHEIGDGSSYCVQDTASDLRSTKLNCSTVGSLKVALWVLFANGSEELYEVTLDISDNGGTPPPTLDGAALYQQHCASCHFALASSDQKGATQQAIKSSIFSVPTMNSLSSLKAEEIAAIAQALK